MIFISSRHDTHFKYVMESLNVNKNVFVEKPLCMSIEELEIIKEKYNSSKSILMVGFNRRFSPLIEKVISFGIRQTPVNINIRVNAGHLEKQHWVHDKEYGGGRVLGEMCHFIDLVLFVTDSDPKKISTFYMKSVDENYDSLNTIIKHKNGSISNISYLSNGGSSLSKEFIEISSGNVTFQIDDFKILRIFSNSVKVIKLRSQDKGHKSQIEKLIHSIKNGEDPPIPFNEIYRSMKTTFLVNNSKTEDRLITY